MSLVVPLLMLAGGALAQNASYFATSHINATTTASNGSTVANIDAYTTALNMNLDDIWNIFVGPVTPAAITTTVEATPVPSHSLIPPPFIHFPAFPPGREVPLSTKNESWSFPKDFFFGVAGAAFQVEGAAKAEGKGPSIWDLLPHRATNYVLNNVTGDVTDNHYYLYKQDIARIAAMGMKHYSFSIAWTRILPFGKGPVNQLGIDHYNDVIDTCLHYNMTPMATLYHWDLPLLLQNEYGGWLSEQIVDDFVTYARIAYSSFGDRVKDWFTINEPIEACSEYPYPTDYFKNYTIAGEHQKFVCGKNILLAHAKAYRLGKELVPNSNIAFKNNGGGKIPATNSSADLNATARAWDFMEGWFADPVFLNGDFNAAVRQYTDDFLPPFTAEERALINGSADFFAQDAYTSSVYFAPDDGVEGCLANVSNPLYPSCYNTSQYYSPSAGGWAIGPAADPLASWLSNAADWVPEFMRDIMRRWNPAGGIAISEMGFAEPYENSKQDLPSILYDTIRTDYYKKFMEALLISISEGIHIRGVMSWSFVDNFEWFSGTSVRFGLQYVNYTTQERHYKASFFEYVNQYYTYLEQ
ncbi:hypothetical protein AAFC00_000245 [Neodothiora populina]|uniref:Beta-glucosidase n=1 Tax=Neodothiora populina TaxID=2781224 RepID=A0ABR3P234_9PEZI